MRYTHARALGRVSTVKPLGCVDGLPRGLGALPRIGSTLEVLDEKNQQARKLMFFGRAFLTLLEESVDLSEDLLILLLRLDHTRKRACEQAPIRLSIKVCNYIHTACSPSSALKGSHKANRAAKRRVRQQGVSYHRPGGEVVDRRQPRDAARVC